MSCIGLRFSVDIIRFEVNPPTLWFISRKILGSSIFVDSIWMFHVLSDGCRTEHGGWELNKNHTHLWPFFVEVTPGNAKFTREYHFGSKFNWKYNFYEVICHHHQTSRRRLEGRKFIMIYLLRSNQNRISVNFWRKKWRFWWKVVSLLLSACM